MEYPIIFNEQSIRAILKGEKTQTRRVISWRSKNPTKTHIYAHAYYEGFINGRFQWYESRDGIETQVLCPYGKIGDYLWVREGLRRYKRLEFLEEEFQNPYLVDTPKDKQKWTAQYISTRTAVPYAPGAKEGWCGTALWEWKNKTIPAIFMPRWASQIILEIKNIWVEQLQDISDEDAMAEGVLNWYHEVQYDENSFSYWSPVNGSGARDRFMEMWNSSNEKTGHSWSSNPWVWVIEFKVL